MPELIPFLAMAGFAGVRRSELVREYAEDQFLKWEDVDWQKHLITVRHEVAKQTPRKMGNRRFIPMEAALLHWLRPYRKREGLVIPLVDSAVRRRMKKLCLHSKLNPPNNALRHSYVSYWLARSSKEGLASFPNEWVILRPSANGTIWKHLLEKKVRVGLLFGARLSLRVKTKSARQGIADR